jgi:uncharacterized protein (DUF58 family)
MIKKSLFSQYLNPEMLAKLPNLELRAKLVVEGFITGLHKSPLHGFSVEFSQHRQYNPGDSLRFIDWKVFARKDRFYIKQYEEETNLKANILLDVSHSMNFMSGQISKLTYGKYLTAALAYLLLIQRDAVGLGLFDTKLIKLLPARSVFSYLQPILKNLDSIKRGQDTDISTVLHIMAERIKRRGLIILISDLLDDPDKIVSGLRHFRHNKHEVLVFHLLDILELNFDYQGDILFEDIETGETVRAHPWYIKENYKEKMAEHNKFLQRQCLENHIDYSLITTDMNLDVALMDYLRKRKRLY